MADRNTPHPRLQHRQRFIKACADKRYAGLSLQMREFLFREIRIL